MSLLMEALKKAEAEKKKAALEQQTQTQRTGEQGVVSGLAGATPGEAPVPTHTGTFDTSRLSLEPLERTPTPTPLPPATSPTDQDVHRYVAAQREYAEDLSDKQAVIDLDAEENYDYGVPISLTEPAASQAAITHPAPLPRFDQTSVLTQPPSSRDASAEATDTVSEQEQSRSGEHIQTPPRRTGPIDTPVAAQAVFIRPPRHRFPSGALAMLMVAGVLIFVGGLWTWYRLTVPAVRQLPASAMHSATSGTAVLPEVQPQANLEQAATSAPPAVAVENPAATAPLVPAEVMTPPAEKTETVTESTATPTAPAPEQATVAAAETKENQPAEKPAPETSVDGKRPQEKSSKEKPSKPKPQIAATDQNQTSASMYDVSPGEIRISTVHASKSVNPKVQEAYGAYQAADYGRAEQLYREVLDKHPDQRDALLGLAAIDQRRGDRAGAAELYGRLLRLNPNDAYAQAAWTALRREQPTVADESELKLLLQQDPQAAHVHYLLGNVYARQARWAEAQQAYFDAYKQDSHNTDYVYNLAVSLDHLGEREAALNYYRMALDLSDKQPVNFVTDQVLGRIQALSDAGGRGPP